MIAKLLITSFIFLTCLNSSLAQKVRKKDKLLIYSPLREFFQRNPSLQQIEISNWRPGGNRMKVVTKADGTLKNEYYELDFEGDKYLFEKKFGKWSFPDSLISSLIDKKAGTHHVTCNVRQDSIFAKISLTYYDPDELVFERIQDSVFYIKGMQCLEKELQASIQDISSANKLTDSVFIFRAILRRDSTLKVDKQVVSDNEAVAKALTAALDKSYPWKPYIHGGIKLNFYATIYIKINNDATVTATIKQP